MKELLKPMPLIFNIKAAKVLKSKVVQAFKVEDNNPNLLRCVMTVGRDRFVDLLNNKEVSLLSVQVLADEASEEDTSLLVGQPEPVEAAQSDDELPIIDETATIKRKQAVKKSKK